MATHKSTSLPEFHGFHSPNFTSVPDEVFDVLMPQLSGAELKVLMYIIRRTFGFKKQQDDISLRQMVEGITTKEGKVLDHGTGLSKDSVVRATASLVAMGAIVRRRNQSGERGDEATTYALNLLPMSENPTGGGPKIRHPRVQKSDTPRVQKSDTQQTVKQQTDIQETVLQQHGGGAAKLIEFGVSEKAAYRIAAEHAELYILDKLDQVKWLLEHKPQAVAENPAGYLCRAIRDNFAPPPGYQSPEQRAKEQEARRREQEAAHARQEAEEEQRQRARENIEQQLRERYPEQPISGTELTTQSGWEQTLKLIQERQLITRAAFATWLKDTRLLWLEGGVATIGCINDWAARYLEQQLYSIITDTLGQVIGRPIDVQFIALEEAHEAHKAA